MKQENVKLIFVIVALIVVVGYIFIGTYIIIDNKSIGFKTESHWYRCEADVPLCQEERENNCTSVKLACEICCK